MCGAVPLPTSSPSRTCPIPVWPPRRRSVPVEADPQDTDSAPLGFPGLPRSSGGRSPRRRPAPSRLEHAPLPRSKQQPACALTAWARGHSPHRTGAALGSPNTLLPAEAWWPRLGLQWGRNRAGGAEWGRGRVPPQVPLFALLTRGWAGATRGCSGAEQEGRARAGRQGRTLLPKGAGGSGSERGSRRCALGGSLPAVVLFLFLPRREKSRGVAVLLLNDPRSVHVAAPSLGSGGNAWGRECLRVSSGLSERSPGGSQWPWP